MDRSIQKYELTIIHACTYNISGTSHHHFQTVQPNWPNPQVTVMSYYKHPKIRDSYELLMMSLLYK